MRWTPTIRPWGSRDRVRRGPRGAENEGPAELPSHLRRGRVDRSYAGDSRVSRGARIPRRASHGAPTTRRAIAGRSAGDAYNPSVVRRPNDRRAPAAGTGRVHAKRVERPSLEAGSPPSDLAGSYAGGTSLLSG